MNKRIKAFQFEQNGVKMYYFLSEVSFIYEKFEVSMRIKNKEEGYQRSFSNKRIKEISNYILKENGIIPNSVLVNIYYEKAEYTESEQKLNFIDSDSLGWIIDGQHRIKGAYNANKNLLIPVIATMGLDTKNQARLFIKINSTQKGVPVSLYLDLLDTITGIIEDFDDESVPAERRAIEIAKRLNDDEESALFDLIRTTGESGRGVSLNEFVSKLKEHVDPRNGTLLDYGFEEQYSIFKIYFKAVKNVFLDQWEDSNSLILKTVGFGGLMKAFYEVFNLVNKYHFKFSTENTIKTLEKIKDLNFDSSTMTGGGIKAQENAGKIIVATLKKAFKEEKDTQDIRVEIEE